MKLSTVGARARMSSTQGRVVDGHVSSAALKIRAQVDRMSTRPGTSGRRRIGRCAGIRSRIIDLRTNVSVEGEREAYDRQTNRDRNANSQLLLLGQAGPE